MIKPAAHSTRFILFLIGLGSFPLTIRPLLADWTAYNDLSVVGSETSINITTNTAHGQQSGALRDVATGQPLPAQLSILCSNTTALAGGQTNIPVPVGSDAYTVFHGRVGLDGFSYFSSGTVSIAFSGLDPTGRYDFALFSSRGFASHAYSNRYADVTITDMTTFTNSSSTGVVRRTMSVSNDTARVAAGNLDGKLIRFTGINPGSDGDLCFLVTPYSTIDSTNVYLNAFMLSQSGGTNTVTTTNLQTRYFKGTSEPSNPTGAWRERLYDASAWATGAIPFGYGDATTYGTALGDMQNSYASLYLRIPFIVTNAALAQTLTLTVDYDDAFIAWVNDSQMQVAASANAPATPTYNALASPDHESSVGGGLPPETHVIYNPGNLVDGMNILSLQAFNVSLGSSDFYLNPTISVSYGTSGGSTTNWGTNTILVPISTPDARQLSACSKRTPLIISEIMYNPPSKFEQRTEFIELFNADPVQVDLSGYRLSGDISYEFPSGTIVSSRCYKVVAREPAAIQSYYGINGVLGPWSNSLPNGNGSIRLRNAQDAILLDIAYSSRNDWPLKPDGSGHSLVMTCPDYGEQDVRAWGSSTTVGGNPGSANPTLGSYGLQNVVINEFLAHTDPPLEDFIELFNRSSNSVNLNGCVLTDDIDDMAYTIGSSNLAARACASYRSSQLGFGLSMQGDTIYLLNPTRDVVLDAIRFGAQENGIASGRYPDGAASIQELTAITESALNGTTSMRLREIVINEVMYHPITEDDNDEFIELYNRSASAVNVGYWRFTEGIDFMIPPNTVIASSNYLVIAKNAAWLRSRHTGLNTTNCIGDYEGTLANGGETVTLAKPDDSALPYQDFVVVDTVAYTDGWGQWADGGGSSLELRDPRSDNRWAGNWADSDETAKASWQSFSTSSELSPFYGWYIDNYSEEVNLLLLDPGEALVDNLQIHKNGGQVFYDDFEGGTGSWVMDGNHQDSGSDTQYAYAGTKSMRIRAQGDGDALANHVERGIGTEFAQTDSATINLRARWVRGTRLLNVRIPGSAISYTCVLPVPSNLGSPAARNSRYTNNAPPALSGVAHAPILPASGQAVTVTAHLLDPDGINLAQLLWRTDGGSWNTVTMNDAGTSGDALTGDGLWSGNIPGQSGTTMVEFYVQARDNQNALQSYPSDYPAHSCLVMFGQSLPSGNFPSYRLWITAATRNTMMTRSSRSNYELDATIIYNNTRAIYGGGIRNRGTPFTRPSMEWPAENRNPEGSLNLNLAMGVPKDEALLGNTSFPLDNCSDGTPNTYQGELLSCWIAEQLGLPQYWGRHVQVYVNGTRKGTIYADMQSINGRYLEANFPDEGSGEVYEVADRFEKGKDDHTSIHCVPLDMSYGTQAYRWSDGTHKEGWYDTGWRKKPQSANDDDASNLYLLLDSLNDLALNDTYTRRIDGMIDVENWARTLAIRHINGDLDGLGYGRTKNALIAKPAMGKWKALLWDLDIFSYEPDPNESVYEINETVLKDKLLAHAPFKRAYWRAFYDAIRGPLQASRYEGQLSRVYSAFQSNGVSGAQNPLTATLGSGLTVPGYLAARRSYLQGQLDTFNNVAFSLTSGNVNTSNSPINLTGVAPVQVTKIKINGNTHPVKWTGTTSWQATVGLNPGTEALVFTAWDASGALIGSNTIQATFTGTHPNPTNYLFINEIMFQSMEAGGDYIEIYNRSSGKTFDLSGWRINGVDFSFPAGTFIGPTSYVVIAEDVSAYSHIYTNTEMVIGDYDGTLDNGGETLSLELPISSNVWSILDTVRYDDDPPWPNAAVGLGSSLQRLDWQSDPARVSSWWAAASNATTGKYTPGAPNALLISVPAYPAIWINELMPKSTSFLDSNGEVSDWLELFNSGSSNFNLGDGSFYLTDDPTQLRKSLLTGTQTLTSSGRLTVWCDANTAQTQNGNPHVNFTLNSASGTVVLVRMVGTFTQIVDYLSYGSISSNRSYGSYPDGDHSQHQIFDSPTPGSINNPVSASPLIVINEWMADNSSVLADPADGDFNDWLELYNPGQQAVDISGWSLTDEAQTPDKFTIPGGWSVPARGYMLIWADDETEQNSPGRDLHVNFKLSANGSYLGLFKPDGQLMSAVIYGRQLRDVTQGSLPDGVAEFQELAVPTPTTTNKALMAIAAQWNTNSTLALNWNIRPGIQYRLLYADSLTSTNWQAALPDIQTNSALLSTTVPASSGNRFYKLVEVR